MLDIADRAHAGQTIHRSFDFTKSEFRDDGPNGFYTFDGVASVVDIAYKVRDKFGVFEETIHAGSFAKTLGELANRAAKAKGKTTDTHVDSADFALFTNHDYRALPLATVSGGRLSVWADPHLAVLGYLNPARPSVQEVRHAVADGDATQMSIGFNVPNDAKKDVWNADYTERHIYEAIVREASIVWQGASPTTSGAMRSMDEFLAEWSWNDALDIERALAFFGNLRGESPAERDAIEAAAKAAIEYEARDRADRERLEMKSAMRPALIA